MRDAQLVLKTQRKKEITFTKSIFPSLLHKMTVSEFTGQICPSNDFEIRTFEISQPKPLFAFHANQFKVC